MPHVIIGSKRVSVNQRMADHFEIQDGDVLSPGEMIDYQKEWLAKLEGENDGAQLTSPALRGRSNVLGRTVRN